MHCQSLKRHYFFDLMLAVANIKAGRLYRSFNHTGSYYDGRTIARARGSSWICSYFRGRLYEYNKNQSNEIEGGDYHARILCEESTEAEKDDERFIEADLRRIGEIQSEAVFRHPLRDLGALRKKYAGELSVYRRG